VRWASATDAIVARLRAADAALVDALTAGRPLPPDTYVLPPPTPPPTPAASSAGLTDVAETAAAVAARREASPSPPRPAPHPVPVPLAPAASLAWLERSTAARPAAPPVGSVEEPAAGGRVGSTSGASTASGRPSGRAAESTLSCHTLSGLSALTVVPAEPPAPPLSSSAMSPAHQEAPRGQFASEGNADEASASGDNLSASATVEALIKMVQSGALERASSNGPSPERGASSVVAAGSAEQLSARVAPSRLISEIPISKTDERPLPAAGLLLPPVSPPPAATQLQQLNPVAQEPARRPSPQASLQEPQPLPSQLLIQQLAELRRLQALLQCQLDEQRLAQQRQLQQGVQLAHLQALRQLLAQPSQAQQEQRMASMAMATPTPEESSSSSFASALREAVALTDAALRASQHQLALLGEGDRGSGAGEGEVDAEMAATDSVATAVAAAAPAAKDTASASTTKTSNKGEGSCAGAAQPTAKAPSPRPTPPLPPPLSPPLPPQHPAGGTSAGRPPPPAFPPPPPPPRVAPAGGTVRNRGSHDSSRSSAEGPLSLSALQGPRDVPPSRAQPPPTQPQVLSPKHESSAGRTAVPPIPSLQGTAPTASPSRKHRVPEPPVSPLPAPALSTPPTPSSRSPKLLEAVAVGAPAQSLPKAPHPPPPSHLPPPPPLLPQPPSLSQPNRWSQAPSGSADSTPIGTANFSTMVTPLTSYPLGGTPATAGREQHAAPSSAVATPLPSYPLATPAVTGAVLSRTTTPLPSFPLGNWTGSGPLSHSATPGLQATRSNPDGAAEGVSTAIPLVSSSEVRISKVQLKWEAAPTDDSPPVAVSRQPRVPLPPLQLGLVGLGAGGAMTPARDPASTPPRAANASSSKGAMPMEGAHITADLLAQLVRDSAAARSSAEGTADLATVLAGRSELEAKVSAELRSFRESVAAKGRELDEGACTPAEHRAFCKRSDFFLLLSRPLPTISIRRARQIAPLVATLRSQFGIAFELPDFEEDERHASLFQKAAAIRAIATGKQPVL